MRLSVHQCPRYWHGFIARCFLSRMPPPLKIAESLSRSAFSSGISWVLRVRRASSLLHRGNEFLSKPIVAPAVMDSGSAILSQLYACLVGRIRSILPENYNRDAAKYNNYDPNDRQGVGYRLEYHCAR